MHNIQKNQPIRLKKRRYFQRATHNGKKIVANSLVLQAVPQNEIDGIRLGFTVTKKMGNAVTRNRIRRRLKAAASHVFATHALTGYDYVIVARKPSFSIPFESLKQELIFALSLFKKKEKESKTAEDNNEKSL